MALDFRDHASGFRHDEVIRFINNEVLMNGGSSDFYTAFRSRPWNEVEDRLRTIVVDPQVSRGLKRACTWSALALGVRVIARQREQHVRRVRRLQERMEERDATSWSMASELQRLRGERDEAVSQLLFTRAALQQVLNECDVLRGRLSQVERSAQVTPLAPDIVPALRAEQLGAAAWPLNAEQQREVGAVGGRGRLYFERQIPSPTAVLYMSGPQSSWAPAVQQPLPISVPNPVPFHPPSSVGFPHLPPLQPAGVTGAETGVVPFQMPPVRIYPPAPWVAAGCQDEMAPPCDQRYYVQAESPQILQGSVLLGDGRNLSQQEGPERPQLMPPLVNVGNHSQEECPQRSQGIPPLVNTGNPSQDEGSQRPQGIPPLVNTGHHSQEECPQRSKGIPPLVNMGNHSQEEAPQRPQGMPLPGDSECHSQEENPERSQDMAPMGDRGSHIQEDGPEIPHGMVPVGDRGDHTQEECPQSPQGMTSLINSGNHSQEESPQRPQGKSKHHNQEEDEERPQAMAPLGNNRSHSQEESPGGPQCMVPLGYNRSQSQKKGLERAQGITPQGSNRSYSQEKERPERAEGMVPPGPRRSQNQEDDAERPQATPVRDNWSQVVRGSPKNQQPQQQKAKKPQGKKSLESQQKEKSASHSSRVNWFCSCKAMNFSWRTTCYKCKKVFVPGESGGIDPGQTY